MYFLFLPSSMKNLIFECGKGWQQGVFVITQYAVRNLHWLCSSCKCNCTLGWGLGFWSSVCNRMDSFLTFCDRKIDSIMKKIELLTLIFFEDQRDWFAHSQSFSKIDRIDLITVDLFKRSMSAIQSRSIFFKIEKIKRLKIEISKIERLNSQPCHW